MHAVFLPKLVDSITLDLIKGRLLVQTADFPKPIRNQKIFHNP
jgi:hypothetical protein